MTRKVIQVVSDTRALVLKVTRRTSTDVMTGTTRSPRILFALLLAGCGTQTICASREAQELDPTLNDAIAQAVAYWDERGYGGLSATDGENCDVPVHPRPLSHYASAVTITNMPGYECYPERVKLSETRWVEVMRRGAQVRVMTHEVGHLHCLDDAEEGVMGWEWHL